MQGGGGGGGQNLNVLDQFVTNSEFTLTLLLFFPGKQIVNNLFSRHMHTCHTRVALKCESSQLEALEPALDQLLQE